MNPSGKRVPGGSPVMSPTSNKSRRTGFQFSRETPTPIIFVRATKFRTDSIITASVELRKRGFIVEVEKEIKSGCYFLLSLTPLIIQNITVTKNLPDYKSAASYSAVEQLIILNSAIDIILESCTFLENREAWIVHEKCVYQKFSTDSNVSNKLLGINNYFGPQIALYFGWLYHYTNLLLYPSVFGVVTFAHQYYYDDIDSSWMPYYAIFIALWTTIFLELSKRQCSTLAFHWGVLDLEDMTAAKDLSKVCTRIFHFLVLIVAAC
jgi:hypothetical protein